MLSRRRATLSHQVRVAMLAISFHEIFCFVDLNVCKIGADNCRDCCCNPVVVSIRDVFASCQGFSTSLPVFKNSSFHYEVSHHHAESGPYSEGRSIGGERDKSAPTVARMML
jgi:hypothetical protein